MIPDPIVEEVRRLRREIAQECNNDIHLLFERHRQQIRDGNARVVTKTDLDERRQRDFAESEQSDVSKTRQRE